MYDTYKPTTTRALLELPPIVITYALMTLPVAGFGFITMRFGQRTIVGIMTGQPFLVILGLVFTVIFAFITFFIAMFLYVIWPAEEYQLIRWIVGPPYR